MNVTSQSHQPPKPHGPLYQKVMEQRLPESVRLEEDLAIHIFTASATLLGVCLTVIGIIRVIIDETKVQTLADDTLALASTLFLGACLSSYWALRARHRQRLHRLEKIADICFICGIVLLTFVSFAITYEFF